MTSTVSRSDKHSAGKHKENSACDIDEEAFCVPVGIICACVCVSVNVCVRVSVRV